MKRRTLIISIIVAVVLIGVAIGWSIALYNWNLQLYDLEYNAQMTANGIYKEDLHLLNQRRELGMLALQMVGAILSGVVGLFIVVWTIVTISVDGIDSYY